MRVILLLFLATYVGAGLLYSSESTSEPSTSEEGFEEELLEGYNVLKSQPYEDDTVRLLKHLYNMEEEMKNELAQSPQEDDELLNEIQKYVGKKDDTQSKGDTIEEINRKNKVDKALFQGDMILTKEQVDEMIEDTKKDESHRNKRQAFRDNQYPKTLWSKGVSYDYWNATREGRTVFKQATELWAAETCINFAEDNRATDKITVIYDGGCWSYVGRLGGTQTLSLGSGCESVGIAAHEIGHALGLFHTQSRHDRDEFITLYPQNFLRGWLSQFTKQTKQTNYNYNLTYDYGSVMHYSATSVSRNGNPVMATNIPKYLQTLGSRIISFYDKLMINMHYGCLDKCNGSSSSAACENGGYPHPRDCSKCICPSGYGGKLCNERPSGCGKTLTATTSYQTLEDKSGDEGSKKQGDQYMMCNYWIEAPSGSTIEVVLDSFSQGVEINGCGSGGIEIKTGADKRYTGYRFCGPRGAGTSLISTHNIVPIIIYRTRYRFTTALRYRIASSGPEATTSSQTTQPTTLQPTTLQPTTLQPTTLQPTTLQPTTLQPTTFQPTTTKSPNCKCKDTPVCPTLMEWKFCTSRKYKKKLRKLLCPKSCGFC